MRIDLPPIVSRALAVALVFALVGAVYVLVVAPLKEHYADAHASISQLQESLLHYRRAEAQLSSREDQLETIKKHTATEEGFLQGGNDTLLALQIEGRVKSLAKSTGSDIESSQVLPTRDEGNMRRIGVRSQVSTTMAGALRLFYGIESAAPILFVDNVDMRTRERRYFRKDKVHPIEIVFDVYGYRQGTR